MKLIPIRPWDDNYNISVWFMNLKGISEVSVVEKVVKDYEEFEGKENKQKWLNLTREIFRENSSGVLQKNPIKNLLKELEEDNLTDFFESLIKGNYKDSLKLLKILEKENYFSNYIKGLPYKVFLREMNFLNYNINETLVKLNLSLKYDGMKIREKTRKEKVILNINKQISEDDSKYVFY